MKLLLIYVRSLLFLLVFVGCSPKRVGLRAPHHYTVLVSGPAGVSFTATIKVDRVTRQISGTAPAHLAYDGKSLDCSFQQGIQLGSLVYTIQDQTGTLGGGATSGPKNTCRFRIQDGQVKSVRELNF